MGSDGGRWCHYIDRVIYIIDNCKMLISILQFFVNSDRNINMNRCSFAKNWGKERGNENFVTWPHWQKNSQTCYYSLIPMFINTSIIPVGYCNFFLREFFVERRKVSTFSKENIKTPKKGLLKRSATYIRFTTHQKYHSLKTPTHAFPSLISIESNL